MRMLLVAFVLLVATASLAPAASADHGIILCPESLGQPCTPVCLPHVPGQPHIGPSCKNTTLAI